MPVLVLPSMFRKNNYLLLCCATATVMFGGLKHAWYGLSPPNSQQEATSSATNNYYRFSLPGRLAEAVHIATELARSDSYLQLVCPNTTQGIGTRRAAHGPHLMGTVCEAWANREWTEMLWHLMDRNMVGLEWSSGSGTLWTLRRGVTLYTVEHCKPWLDQIKTKIAGNFPHLMKRWFPVHIDTSKGCRQSFPDDWAVLEETFGEYARYPRVILQQKHNVAPDGFDVINIDGRFRDGCLLESLRPSLLKQQYGILLLDNAERPFYRKPQLIPSHWLVVSFSNAADESALWMSCPTPQDALCQRARQEIVIMMQNIPQQFVGSRYKAHMARAKADGVPGA